MVTTGMPPLSTTDSLTNPATSKYQRIVLIGPEESSTLDTETNRHITSRVTAETSTKSTDTTQMDSTSASHVPLDISLINSDPCISITPDMCNNRSGNDMIPNYCECTHDGVWTIIQKRFDGSVDFHRDWKEYKDGFGDVNGEFWLGNGVIYQMTSNENFSLKIILKDWDNITKYVMYGTFRIANQDDGYRLTIGDYSGEAGDSMTTRHNGRKFRTFDRDNDESDHLNCAERDGAWWHSACYDANLNGFYQFGPTNPEGNGVIWIYWDENVRRGGHSLKETKLMIKSNE